MAGVASSPEGQDSGVTPTEGEAGGLGAKTTEKPESGGAGRYPLGEAARYGWGDGEGEADAGAQFGCPRC